MPIGIAQIPFIQICAFIQTNFSITIRFLNKNLSSAQRYTIFGKTDDALDIKFLLIIWRMEDDYISAIRMIDVIRKFVDDDVLIIF